MSAYYDDFDYPSYWKGREYEHQSELISLKTFLDKIPKINTLIEIGAGFGRLIPTYLFRSKKIILSDPSVKLLNIAKKNFKSKNIKFIQSKIENLSKKIRSRTADLLICVRVLHHIKDIDIAFSNMNRLLKKGGYLILEFPNKCHGKAAISEFLKGNFTFLLDIFPKEVKSKGKRKKTLPFFNYHPDIINEKLTKHGFKIIERRSVSNVRSPTLKKLFNTEVLLLFERNLQRPLSKISFGPSIFILAKKIG